MVERVVQGITHKQVESLVFYTTTDPLIDRFTSDVKKQRFTSVESYGNWLGGKERSIYTLVDESSRLLGMVWLGQERIPEREYIFGFKPENFEVTFAIRIYGETRGKGLAWKFMEEAIGMFKVSEEYQRMENKGIWLEVSDDNVPAVKAYERFGFVKVTYPNEEGKILMILP